MDVHFLFYSGGGRNIVQREAGAVRRTLHPIKKKGREKKERSMRMKGGL